MIFQPQNLLLITGIGSYMKAQKLKMMMTLYTVVTFNKACNKFFNLMDSQSHTISVVKPFYYMQKTQIQKVNCLQSYQDHWSSLGVTLTSAERRFCFYICFHMLTLINIYKWLKWGFQQQKHGDPFVLYQGQFQL